jgi:hypothetical protein
MNHILPSPRILEHSWGSLLVEVEGEAQQFKDAKLFPGGCRSWNWRETGTEHTPGIQLADVEELLEHGASVVVLSRGVLGRLQAPDETVRQLEERGVTVYVARTAEAVQLYNQLRENSAVGALIHSTC